MSNGVFVLLHLLSGEALHPKLTLNRPGRGRPVRPSAPLYQPLLQDTLSSAHVRFVASGA